MCLAVPMKLEAIDGEIGTVDIGGVKRNVGLTLIEEPKVGDYLLVHAGFAIQKIDEDEAAETIKLLKELVDKNEASI